MTEQNQIKAVKKNSLKGDIFSITLVIIIAISIRTFVMELFYVPTDSMKGTILEGDYIFSTKYDYGYSIYSVPFSPDLFPGRAIARKPQRGDVIIMRPPHDMDKRYIKRLIGLPGDKIEIIDDLIYINDEPIMRQEFGEFTSEKGVSYFKYKEVLPNGKSYFSYKEKDKIDTLDIDHSNYGPYFVEEDKYFFIGDNRDNSGDSRYQLGTVPFRNFIAKGRFVIFSTKEPLWDPSSGLIEQIKRVWTWITSIRLNRIFLSLDNIENQTHE